MSPTDAGFFQKQTLKDAFCLNKTSRFASKMHIFGTKMSDFG
jgi:hypothetical protein